MKKFLEIINEESDVEEISDSELDQMAAALTWEDIADLYEADPWWPTSRPRWSFLW